MSYQLKIRKRAEKNIAEAYVWYEKQRLGLGDDFLLCTDAAIMTIISNPFLFQIRHKNIHCALIPRFPYGLFYFVDNEKIIVAAVFHLSRDPKLWKK
jgi:toxin ParE1/3/4